MGDSLKLSIPDYQSLMLPVLRVAGEGEISAREAVERLADEYGLSQEERDQPMPSGGSQTLFGNRVHWAITYLVHAGILTRPRRGHFAVTDRGRQVLAEGIDRIDNEFLKRFPEFSQWINQTQRGRRKDKPAITHVGSMSSRSEEAQTPYERIESDVRSLELGLQSDLLDRLLEASPVFFENVVVDLLVAMGYGGSREEAARRIGRSGDGGVDGVIDEDPLGLDIIYVQAKRYHPDNKVSRPAIQGFAGSLDGFGANKGVFVTTSSFTREAVEFAERVSRRIILIDGEELARLMSRYGVGIRVSANYEIKRIDEDYFSAE